MIAASGATVGLPDLRSGCNVEIIGFGVARSDTKGNRRDQQLISTASTS